MEAVSYYSFSHSESHWKKTRHRKQCYLGLVLLRRRQSKAREPSSLLPVNAVLFLTIYIWLFCTFIQSESPSAYLTFLASISKIIYFRECLQCCQFCFHVKTKHKCLSKDTTRFVPDYAYYAKEREHNTKSTQCSTNCTLVDFKSPCVVLWKKVLRGINVALAEGIWEIKSFISTAQSASCFSVVGSLLLKVFLFFSAACLEYLDYSG